MFKSLRPDFNVKQLVTFIAALWLQVTVLLILGGIPTQKMSGHSIRLNAIRSASVTPIYFHEDRIATPSTPAPSESHLPPELPSEANSTTEQEVNTQAETTDGSSGKGEEQGLAPFSSWRMNSTPSSFTVMHHQIKTALPVFTPDPPILHGEVPELARGKDVILEVVIDDQGSIVRVEVLKAVGYGVEDSIMQTLRRWIFVPAKINGVAIASRRQLHFHFPG
jgi:TonB family protein